MSRHQIAKCKIFCGDPTKLQHILDVISNAFGRNVILSSINPCQEGDYHAFVTWFEEGV